jgi:hypothetical protein
LGAKVIAITDKEAPNKPWCGIHLTSSFLKSGTEWWKKEEMRHLKRVYRDTWLIDSIDANETPELASYVISINPLTKGKKGP